MSNFATSFGKIAGFLGLLASLATIGAFILTYLPEKESASVVSRLGQGSTKSTSGSSSEQPVEEPRPGHSPGHVPPPHNKSDIAQFINRADEPVDIAVFAVNSALEEMDFLSGEISDVYRSTGFKTTTSLFTNGFTSSEYWQELKAPSKNLLHKLSAASNVKFIVLVRYQHEFDTGEYTKYVCRGSLDVSIISCEQAKKSDSFKIIAASGFDDKLHAEKGLIEKLIDDYRINHPTPL